MGDTLTKGDFAEVAVMKDLMKKGYKVCIPYGSDWRFDLLVLKDNKYYKVQVKACLVDKRKAGIRFIVRNFSMGPYTKKRVKYNKDEIDYIAAYDPLNDNVFYIPIESFDGRGEMSFRYTKDDIRQISNKAQVNLIQDYAEIKT